MKPILVLIAIIIIAFIPASMMDEKRQAERKAKYETIKHCFNELDTLRFNSRGAAEAFAESLEGVYIGTHIHRTIKTSRFTQSEHEQTMVDLVIYKNKIYEIVCSFGTYYFKRIK